MGAEPGDFESYLAGWRARRDRTAASREEARVAALALARELALLLVERFRVHRVALVGSLARGDFDIGSDIDLAVEGLATDALFRAGAELEKMAGGMAIDLVPLESASSAYRQHVADEGIVLA